MSNFDNNNSENWSSRYWIDGLIDWIDWTAVKIAFAQQFIYFGLKIFYVQIRLLPIFSKKAQLKLFV